MAADKTSTPQAQQFAMVLELAKNMTEQNALLMRIADSLDELCGYFQIGAAADATGTPASSPAPATPATSSTPASPASTSGMESMIEGMIASQLGVPIEDLRAGKIDQAVVQKLMADALSKRM